MSDLQEQLEAVFADVFGRTIPLSDELSAKDVEDWDSLQHINLIVAIEKRFRIRFATAEISSLKGDDQTVGTLLRLLERKLSPRGNDA